VIEDLLARGNVDVAHSATGPARYDTCIAGIVFNDGFL
jgi:hypothetical protein